MTKRDRATGLAILAVSVTALASPQTAAAVVSSDTLAGPDCNSTAHRETLEEYEDGSSFPHEDEDWGVAREIDLTATGKRNSRHLNLRWFAFNEVGNPQPSVARNFFYNQGSDEDPMTRETTVDGESSVAVQVRLGETRIIDLGTFTPDWGDVGSNRKNRVTPLFGGGVGTWSLSIPLREHLKKLRAHEYKAKGSRSRVSLTYKFPATTFVRQEGLSFGDVDGTATQTTDWTSADCDLLSRRLRLSTR